MLTDQQVAEAAAALYEAERTGDWTEPVSDRYPDAEIDDAYRIAKAVADLKLAGGRTIKGHKVGLTSAAMRSLTGATEPDYGFLFDDWFVPECSTVDKARMNRPLVEVELAFVMKRALPGPSVNAADVIGATDFVLPSIEIVDSRFSRRGSVMLIDSIADAASCGFVVLGGNPASLIDIDPRRISASLSINGDVRESGSAAAVLGNPVNAVAWLANKLHQFGVTIQEGDVVLPGSFVKAIPFEPGDTITAQFDQLGEVVLSVAR